MQCPFVTYAAVRTLCSPSCEHGMGSVDVFWELACAFDSPCYLEMSGFSLAPFQLTACWTTPQPELLSCR